MSDLVERLRRLYVQTGANYVQEAADEILRLRSALNCIASWNEGPEVNGSFDEPGSAQVARDALGATVQPDVISDKSRPLGGAK